MNFRLSESISHIRYRRNVFGEWSGMRAGVANDDRPGRQGSVLRFPEGMTAAGSRRTGAAKLPCVGSTAATTLSRP